MDYVKVLHDIANELVDDKEHLKVKEIAEIIHTSSSYITKIIKLDKRYLEEKEYRNNKSKESIRL